MVFHKEKSLLKIISAAKVQLFLKMTKNSGYSLVVSRQKAPLSCSLLTTKC